MKNHIKELDGLRGLAVLLVIAFHTFKRAIYLTKNPVLLFITNCTSIGWVGVDIFFTLSGFLITTILLRSRESKNYFKNFYARRALRIFPLYYIGIVVIILFAPKLEGEFVTQLSKILPIMLVYQQNWLTIFGDMRLTQYLSVTWSLAIEEQFYLLWPCVVYYAKKEQLIKISIWVIGLSIMSRVVGTVLWSDHQEYFVFFYYNSFTRFEEILVGGLLAILFDNKDNVGKIRQFALPSFVVSLLAFLVLCLVSLPGVPHPIHSNIPFTVFGYSVAAVLSASLIAVFMTHSEESFLRRFFSSPILSFFGKYSYSMYLFHMTFVILVMEYFWHAHMLGWYFYLLYIGMVFLLTTLTGWFTWQILEKHVLYLKKYFVTE